MLKNNKLLFDFKEEIKTKYNYDEELAQTIAMTAESLIDYFGNEYENIILEAIKSCKYIIAKPMRQDEHKNWLPSETIYDVMKREGKLEYIENATVTDGDFKRANGVYSSRAIVSEENGQFKLDRVDRIIVLPYYFNHENPSSLGTITHETMHLVKAYVNEYKIEGDMLIERGGLSKNTYKLSSKDGKVQKTFVSELGVGFEEGINSYDEQKVIRSSYDENFDVHGYAYQRIVGAFIADSVGLAPNIKNAQLSGDISEIKKIFDENMENGFEAFLMLMDENVKLEYRRFATIMDPDKNKEVLTQLQEQFEKKIVPQVRNFNHNLHPELHESLTQKQ